MLAWAAACNVPKVVTVHADRQTSYFQQQLCTYPDIRVMQCSPLTHMRIVIAWIISVGNALHQVYGCGHTGNLFLPHFGMRFDFSEGTVPSSNLIFLQDSCLKAFEPICTRSPTFSFIHLTQDIHTLSLSSTYSPKVLLPPSSHLLTPVTLWLSLSASLLNPFFSLSSPTLSLYLQLSATHQKPEVQESCFSPFSSASFPPTPVTKC